MSHCLPAFLPAVSRRLAPVAVKPLPSGADPDRARASGSARMEHACRRPA
jgi:hypothetical protein